MPKPNISEDNAALSRKICLMKPPEDVTANYNHDDDDLKSHSHEETPDFIVYHPDTRYLWIHLESMEYHDVEIDLSMFDLLDIDYCYIEAATNKGRQRISLRLTTANKDLRIHHMLCIKGVRHLVFGDECLIKSPRIWLLQNHDVLILD
eukprot:418059_1